MRGTYVRLNIHQTSGKVSLISNATLYIRGNHMQPRRYPSINRSLNSFLTVFVYLRRFSAAFQLMTSQMALKYSAFLFWYWR